ncbi:MAG: DUF6788 family protein [Acidimicrobiales bacterium]
MITHRRRCGKRNCRCATAEALHESVVLSYSIASRTKFVMLRADEVEQVRAATKAFRATKAELEARADKGLTQLAARRARRS